MEVLWAETTFPWPILPPTHAQTGEEQARLCLFTWSEKGKGGEALRPQAALEPHSNLYSTRSCPKPQMGHGLLSPGR